MVAYCPKCGVTVIQSGDSERPFHCENCGKDYDEYECHYAHYYSVIASQDGVCWKQVFAGKVDEAINEAEHFLLNGYAVKMEIVEDEWEVE